MVCPLGFNKEHFVLQAPQKVLLYWRMVTALLAAIVMQGPGFTVFREPPPIPQTTRREFNIGGGYVISCTYTWSDWQPDGESGLDYCNHHGVRKLHPSHLACTDGNCRNECVRPHNMYGNEFDAIVEMRYSFGKDMEQWARDMEERKGILSSILYDDISFAPLLSDLRDALSEIRKDKKYSPYLGEHFADSCEGADRNLNYVTSTCTLTYQLRAATLNIIYVEDSIEAATLKTVGQGLIRRTLHCMCDPTTNPPKTKTQVALLPPIGSQPPVSQGNTGIWVDEEGDGEYVAIRLADAESKYKIKFNSDRMTTYNVSCSSGPTAPEGVIIVPGFTLVSGDRKVQDLLVCGGVTLAPKDGVVTATGRAACLNMRKRTPTLATKYKPVESALPELGSLAIFHHHTQISGPWDQARTWMFTDGASYNEIGKFLQPMIPPSRFVKEIMNLQNMAVPASHPRLKSVFDPDFLKLGELTEVERATYAQKAWIADEARCLKWLKDQPMVSEPGFAALASEGLFRNPETTSEFLAEKLKKLKKDAFTKQDGWNLLGAALYSSNAKAAGIALRAMESNPDRAQLWYLLNPDPQLPADIRNRAEKLGKSLEPKG